MQTFLEKQEAGKDFHASPITHAPDTYLPRPSPGCPGSERCLRQPQKLKRHPQCWGRCASTSLSSMRGRSLPSAPGGPGCGETGRGIPGSFPLPAPQDTCGTQAAKAAPTDEARATSTVSESRGGWFSSGKAGSKRFPLSWTFVGRYRVIDESTNAMNSATRNHLRMDSLATRHSSRPLLFTHTPPLLHQLTVTHFLRSRPSFPNPEPAWPRCHCPSGGRGGLAPPSSCSAADLAHTQTVGHLRELQARSTACNFYTNEG